jgi:predicted AlkP superfamily pyrophosphatase or phosphodiesterase
VNLWLGTEAALLGNSKSLRNFVKTIFRFRLVPAAACLVALVVLTAWTAQAPVSGSGGVNRPEHRGKPHIVLVSLDGFRADYLDRYDAPNLRRIMRQGVRAEALLPVFPSKTFPSHYSIVTGMYSEHHGLVSNQFYDPKRNETYSLGNRTTVEDGAWYRGEPIWVAAEKQGMVAATFFWPGSEAAINAVRPTYWKRYDGSVPNEDRVDAVLDWLRLPHEKRPHFAALYFSDVDSAAHRFGPFAAEVETSVRSVDRMIGRLLDGFESLEIRNRIYLIVVSDHGMALTTPAHYLAIDSLIDTSDVRLSDSGPTANLHVSGPESRAREVRDRINRTLKNGRAYLRAEVPRALHYSEDPRIGDVVIIMDSPYQIGPEARRPQAMVSGAHGWDPAVSSAMHGIFLALGPDLKSGATIAPFQNIEVYSLLAELLDLKAAPSDSRPRWLHSRIVR